MDRDTPLLLDQTSVAELLGISPRTLEAWRHRGGGPPFVKVGRRVLYRREDVAGYIESRVCASTSDATVRGLGGGRTDG